MVRKSRKDRDRLKIDMQFQVHTAGDDKMLRGGKRYGQKICFSPSKRVLC